MSQSSEDWHLRLQSRRLSLESPALGRMIWLRHLADLPPVALLAGSRLLPFVVAGSAFSNSKRRCRENSDPWIKAPVPAGAWLWPLMLSQPQMLMAALMVIVNYPGCLNLIRMKPEPQIAPKHASLVTGILKPAHLVWSGEKTAHLYYFSFFLLVEKLQSSRSHLIVTQMPGDPEDPDSWASSPSLKVRVNLSIPSTSTGPAWRSSEQGSVCWQPRWGSDRSL